MTTVDEMIVKLQKGGPRIREYQGRYYYVTLGCTHSKEFRTYAAAEKHMLAQDDIARHWERVKAK